MSSLIPILTAYSLAAIIPGPAAILVMEYASFGPRKLARILALGVSLGSFAWVAAVVFGLGTLLRAFPGLATSLKYGSALLLTYFLIKTVIVIAKPSLASVSGREVVFGTVGSTFMKGFLMNLLSPAALVFFLGLFAPMLAESPDPSDLTSLVVGVSIISLIWYQSLVSLVSHPRVQPFLLSSERWLRVGFALMYLYFLMRLLGFA